MREHVGFLARVRIVERKQKRRNCETRSRFVADVCIDEQKDESVGSSPSGSN